MILRFSPDLSIRTQPLMNTALFYASHKGNLECARSLLDYDKSILEIPNMNGDTALHLAVTSNNIGF